MKNWFVDIDSISVFVFLIFFFPPSSFAFVCVPPPWIYHFPFWLMVCFKNQQEEYDLNILWIKECHGIIIQYIIVMYPGIFSWYDRKWYIAILRPKIILEIHFIILLNLLFRYGIKFETGKFFVVTIINKTQICRSKETQVCLLGCAKNLVEDKICAIFVSSMIWIIRTSLSWFTMYASFFAAQKQHIYPRRKDIIAVALRL